VAEQAVVMLREEEITADVLRPLLRDLGDDTPDADASSSSDASATGLMRVPRDSDTSSDDQAPSSIRERELLYRAILEMRMEMRDMKEQLSSLMSTIGVVIPRDVAERSDFPGAYDDFIVVGNAPPRPESAAGEAADSLIRDVVYEVDDSTSPGRSSPDRSSRDRDAAESTASEDAVPASNGASAPDANGAPHSADEPPADAASAQADAADDDADTEDDSLPTLEEAEHTLISRALKQFDGNRRKTAQALGISERTLYRKLKDIDEDL
jgi:hypothetical protein